MERSVQIYLAILWVTETTLNKMIMGFQCVTSLNPFMWIEIANQCIFSYSANVKYELGTVQNYLRIWTSILSERKTYSTTNELRWKKMAKN